MACICVATCVFVVGVESSPANSTAATHWLLCFRDLEDAINDKLAAIKALEAQNMMFQRRQALLQLAVQVRDAQLSRYSQAQPSMLLGNLEPEGSTLCGGQSQGLPSRFESMTSICSGAMNNRADNPAACWSGCSTSGDGSATSPRTQQHAFVLTPLSPKSMEAAGSAGCSQSACCSNDFSDDILIDLDELLSPLAVTAPALGLRRSKSGNMCLSGASDDEAIHYGDKGSSCDTTGGVVLPSSGKGPHNSLEADMRMACLSEMQLLDFHKQVCALFANCSHSQYVALRQL
jgi:hypothetical protein